MRFRVFVLSIVCISCVIPSTVSFNLMAAKAVASQAAQDLAAIKADTMNAKKAAVVKAFSDIADITANGLALKGQAIKKAATSIAGSLINGATSIGSTIARAGIDMVAAKFGIVKPKPACVIKLPFVNPAPVLQDPIQINRPDNIIPSLHPPKVSFHVRHPMIFPPIVPQRNIFKKPANNFGFLRPAGSRFAIMAMPRFDGPVMEAIQYGKR